MQDIPLTFHLTRNDHRAIRRPMIVFVHHFGGSSTSSHRHVGLLQTLGFNCVTFSLSWHGAKRRVAPPWGKHHWGIMDHWSDEIAQVLKQLDEHKEFGPDTEKILYAFSGPGAAAFREIARRYTAKNLDVQGLILDSGPFYNPRACTRTMLREVYNLTLGWWREIILTLMMLSLSLRPDEELHRALWKVKETNGDLPILSFQGSRDTIVPPKNIEAALRGPKFRDLNEVILPTGHLTGLRDFPGDYDLALKNFLARWP